MAISWVKKDDTDLFSMVLTPESQSALKKAFEVLQVGELLLRYSPQQIPALKVDVYLEGSTPPSLVVESTVKWGEVVASKELSTNFNKMLRKALESLSPKGHTIPKPVALESSPFFKEKEEEVTVEAKGVMTLGDSMSALEIYKKGKQDAIKKRIEDVTFLGHSMEGVNDSNVYRLIGCNDKLGTKLMCRVTPQKEELSISFKAYTSVPEISHFLRNLGFNKKSGYHSLHVINAKVIDLEILYHTVVGILFPRGSNDAFCVHDRRGFLEAEGLNMENEGINW